VTSRRQPSFTVTAAGQKVSLDPSGSAQASFTVTNTSPEGHRGRLLTRPRDPAKPEWFSVVGDSVRTFAPNAAEQVIAQLNVPSGSPAGSYSFRLDAVSEDDPDEDYTEGPSVAFEVAPPPAPTKKKFPWWILIVVAAVVLLIVIGVVVFLVVRDRGNRSAVLVGPWSGSGTPTTTVTSDGTKSDPVFNYSVQGRSGSWTFSTTTKTAQKLAVEWHYKGYHAYFQITVKIERFVAHAGTETATTLVSAGPVNCCAPPSGGFDYTGTTTFDLQPGDTYGFRMSGTNADSDARLLGTLTLQIFR
jgi:hypothetical protein